MNNTTHWIAPSNIAFIKYWGKSGLQIPMNPSISMTLKESSTDTKVLWCENQEQLEPDFSFFFEGKNNEKFHQKVKSFFERISPFFPLINKLQMEIYSKNTFPHSTGIASSASSFAALALCLTEIEYKLTNRDSEINSSSFIEKASFLARLGSGSACRSVYSNYAIWGDVSGIENTSNEYAIGVDFVHDNFKNLNGMILIVDESPKIVSSSVGHDLMKEHTYRDLRIKEVQANLKNLLDSLKSGDLNKFGTIIEKEALSLHALMMTSNPPFILFKPNTLNIIDHIKKQREEKNIPMYFTMDAGPNVHLIYPHEFENEVNAFYNDVLKQFTCSVINDKIGAGPSRISPNGL